MNQMTMPGLQHQIPAAPMNGNAMGIANHAGAATPHSNDNSTEAIIVQMNTCIYDYFIKNGHHQCARAMVKGDALPMNVLNDRRDGEANGVDGDSTDADGKDNLKSLPEDLPRPNPNKIIGGGDSSESFLLEWFMLFWELFGAQRKKAKIPESQMYINQTQNSTRMRDEARNQMLQQRQNPMMGQMNAYRMNNLRPNDLQKAAMQNVNRTGSMMMRTNQGNIQQQLQRDQSDMDMNGVRPQSPASAENAPSPSKRPRLEGNPQLNGPQGAQALPNGQQLPNGHPMANGQPMPNGRGQPQGMPGQAGQPGNGMMMGLNAQQFRAYQQQNPGMQNKAMQVLYLQNSMAQHGRSLSNEQGMPNGMMNNGMMPTQSSPMMGPAPDGPPFMPMQDIYPNGSGRMTNQMPANNGQGGNHALQDYQMQLMLLEQQNKKRLMMARQEHETMQRPEGAVGMPNHQQMPPGMSPQGSRQGPSPNPSDQMRRGTPKMGQAGLPGSPAPGDTMAQARGSPAAMSFNGQVAGDINSPFFMKGMNGEVMVPPNMRPPSSNPGFHGPQMDGTGRGQPAGRMPSGGWPPGIPQQGQPMMPQTSQQQAQQPQVPATGPQHVNMNQQVPAQAAANAQERSQMPPPQAPTTTGAAPGRTQPSSPQGSTAAPPTPQQTNKPNPKGKKETEKNRKRNTKKPSAAATAAATPSSEAEPPPTPTPATPITPAHPATFSGSKGGASSSTGTAAAGNTSNAPAAVTASVAASAAASTQSLQAQAPEQMHPFDMGMTDPSYGLGFDALEDPGVGLDNFDFDSFLNTQDDTSGLTFDTGMFTAMDGVEAGDM